MAHVLVFSGANKGILVALLLEVEFELGPRVKQNLGLLLRRVESPDHTRKLYVPCSPYRSSSRPHIIALDRDPQQAAACMRATLEWRTIYIVRRGTPVMDPPELQMVSANVHAPFYIPRSEIKRFLELSANASCSLHPENPTDLSWRRHVALKADLSLLGTPMRVVIYLGLCEKASLDHPQHWARIVEYGDRDTEVDEAEREVEHVCAEHHVDERPTQSHPLTVYNKQATVGSRSSRASLELSFKPYALSFTRCRRVSIRFNPREDSIGSLYGGSRSMALTATHVG